MTHFGSSVSVNMASCITEHLSSMQLVGLLVLLPVLLVSGEETKVLQPKTAKDAKPFIGLLDGKFPSPGNGGPLDVLAEVGHAVGNIFNLFSDPRSKISVRSRSQGSLDTPKSDEVETFTQKSPVNKFFRGIFGIGRKECKDKKSKSTPKVAAVSTETLPGESASVKSNSEAISTVKVNSEEVTTLKQEDVPSAAPEVLQSAQSDATEAPNEANVPEQAEKTEALQDGAVA